MTERKLSEELRAANVASEEDCVSVSMAGLCEWTHRAAALEAELAAEKAHTARLEKYDVLYTENRRKLEAEVAAAWKECGKAEDNFRSIETERDALAAENEKLRAFNLPSDHAMRTAQKMHAELAAENTALKARIAEVVKVLRDGDGPVEDDFEGAVREALAILEPEGEKP